MWDLIVSVPDHCLSFYFAYIFARSLTAISEQRRSIGGTPVATSIASLLEVCGALIATARTLLWTASNLFQPSVFEQCQTEVTYSMMDLTNETYRLISFCVDTFARPFVSRMIFRALLDFCSMLAVCGPNVSFQSRVMRSNFGVLLYFSFTSSTMKSSSSSEKYSSDWLNTGTSVFTRIMPILHFLHHCLFFRTSPSNILIIILRVSSEYPYTDH